MPETEKKENEPDPGMDTQDLKRLLRIARRQPVSCALGTRPDGCVVVLDKVKPPKVLLAQLRKSCPDLRTPAFGTAAVSVEADPKLVTFQLNKALPGLQKRLRVTLKGTGFTKVAVERASTQGAADDEA